MEQGRRKDGELIFVSGHPGRTNRLDTVKHLEFLRDVAFPCSGLIRRREVTLKTFAERGLENRPPSAGRLVQLPK